MLRKRLVLRYRGMSSCIAFRPGSRWVSHLARLPLGAPFGQSPASHRILSDAPFDRGLVGRAYFFRKMHEKPTLLSQNSRNVSKRRQTAPFLS